MEEQKHLLYGSGGQRNNAESSYQSRRGAGGEYYTHEEERGALTNRGILLVVLAALGVFGVAAASSRSSAQTVAAPAGANAKMNYATIPRLRTVEDGPMIEPTVTTEICAGDKSLPVLQGVDVVAYQTLAFGGLPVYGSEDYTSELYGYTFWFSSQENKEAFDADTDMRSPMYGGFCAYGVAAEVVWSADTLGPASNPNYWYISPKGRLYIFRSATPRDEFIMNLSEDIEHANALWQGWFTADEPYNTACFCTDDTCADQ